MRRPTAVAKQFSWWSRAIAGEKPSVTSEPHCGYFKRKFVRDGAWVPARIFLEQPIDAATGELVGDEVMRCEVGGRAYDPVDQWTWICGNPIEAWEYEYLMARKAWAEQHRPDQPEANPRSKVDHNKTPIPF